MLATHQATSPFQFLNLNYAVLLPSTAISYTCLFAYSCAKNITIISMNTLIGHTLGSIIIVIL